MSDLLPCPFCGGSAKISTRTDECIWSHDQVEWTAVSCSGGSDFDCFQPSVDWPTSATDDNGTQLSISEWNRRAIPAAEAEHDALRAKVARLEGVLRHYRETLCEGFCGEDMWADEGHSHPEIQRDCGGCLAASVLLSAALTDGGKDG